MLSIADIIDNEHNLCKYCTWKNSCKGIISECIICNSSNEDDVHVDWNEIDEP